jgi:hypothetical protein
VNRSAVLFLVAPSLLAVAACGARAELIVQRVAPSQQDASAPDAVAVDVVAGDSSRPDAGPLACSLGPIVVLKRRMEPSFLLSFTAIEGGGYAFTMASGWMGLASPALVVLDQNLQETSAVATPRLEVAHALQGVRRLYTVTSERDPTRNLPVESAFYELSPRLERVPSTQLCVRCVVRDRPAAQRAGQIAVSMSTQALDNGGVIVANAMSGELVGSAFAADLRDPSALAVTQGWYAVSQSTMAGALSRALFTEPLMNARALQPVAVGFDGNAAPWLVRADSSTIAAVGMAREGGRTVLVTMVAWPDEGSLQALPTISRTVGAAGATAQGLSATARADLGLVAIAWGEQIGDNGGGAWITVVDAQARPVLAQTSASEPVANSQSYTIYTAVAPHPEGFVVAWNGWQRQANYAIYARVVRCR